MEPGKVDAALRRAAEHWAAHDPDPRTRHRLLEQLESGDVAALRSGFDNPLEFGTAGLRGAVGPGPGRMNLAVVLRVSWALARYLEERSPSDLRPILIGYDARAESAGFARAAAAVHAALGQRVWLCATPGPTPWIAFGVRHFTARAGVVLTPSHNPRGDAGYKLYDDEGVQIVSAWDTGVAGWLALAPAADEIPQSAAGVETCPSELFEAYDAWLDRVASLSRGAAPVRPLCAVYTPLHGVGLSVARAAAARAGALLEAVAEQAEPDGTFPTTPFPNPEEAEVWPFVRQTCQRSGLDWALANDPDADRLALAVARRPGAPVEPLSGDQLGLLLADAWLEALGLPDALVISTLVSSPGLERVARLHGARVERTLTGFKWLGRPALSSDRFAFSYEEALGYCFGFGADKLLLDKDGLAALVAIVGLVQREADQSHPTATPSELLLARLGRLASRIGLWTSHGHSLRFGEPRRRGEKVEALAGSPPSRLRGRRVLGVTDYRSGSERRPSYQGAQDLVVLDLEGDARICVRPSGTEPKLKLYVHLRSDFSVGDDFAAVEESGRDEATSLARALADALGV